VPTGAHFDGSNSHTFDENTIVRHGQAYGVPGRTMPSGSRYQPRRKTSHSRVPTPTTGSAKSAPTASPSTPAAKPGAAPTGPKPNPHAKPSPATRMPVQPTQGKRTKPSPSTPMQATGGLPSPQPAKKS
jgi:hypothetical protein